MPMGRRSLAHIAASFLLMGSYLPCPKAWRLFCQATSDDWRIRLCPVFSVSSTLFLWTSRRWFFIADAPPVYVNFDLQSTHSVFFFVISEWKVIPGRRALGRHAYNSKWTTAMMFGNALKKTRRLSRDPSSTQTIGRPVICMKSKTAKQKFPSAPHIHGGDARLPRSFKYGIPFWRIASRGFVLFLAL